jgi:hypothetical protein
MRNRQVVTLTGIEDPYPALSEWAVQIFMDCQKNQELQGEVYITIPSSINKHAGKDTVTILRDNFLTTFNKSGRSLWNFFPATPNESDSQISLFFLFLILRYEILRLPSF